MLHGNQRDIYNYLYNLYLKDYRSFWKDEYAGQNKLQRMATAYAVRNTVHVWQEESKKRRCTDGT